MKKERNNKKVLVLYSGGKDSSLSAAILKLLGYDIELATITFGLNENHTYAEKAARALGFKHETILMDKAFLEEACELMIKDGFPNNGLDLLHKNVLEEIADLIVERGNTAIIADGIRRDDKAPKLTLSEVKSLEDRKGISYISPLMGFGHKEIDMLAGSFFIFEEGESGKINKGDYESEIWKYLKAEGCKIEEIFPKNHKQSIVSGFKPCWLPPA